MLLVSCDILGGDYDHGGNATHRVKEQLKKLGADPAVVRRATIAAYEAEMNVVIHARKGILRAQMANGCLEFEVVDEGPGIADIDRAMQEGYSTAPAIARDLGFGAGLGLPNIRKNSDRFRLKSTVGVGTGVYFSLDLRPQSLYGTVRHSLAIDRDRCRASRPCLSACPTLAVRLRHDRPVLLDYLCIDCTACIGVCPGGAWSVRGVEEDAVPSAETILVIDAPFLMQFAPQFGPMDALAALRSMGFVRVHLLDAWHQALRAVLPSEAAPASVRRPLISPGCPAAVNLITLRFPSLIPQVSAHLSPVEALTSTLGDEHVTLVLSCPSQKSALEPALDRQSPSESRITFSLPGALRVRMDADLRSRTGTPRNSKGHAASAHSPSLVPDPRHDPTDASPGELVRVTGERAVVRALESVETGQLNDVGVLEPWMCPEGCFGSPLYRLHPTVARHRWLADGARMASDPQARAVRRERPLVPRSGLRLDADMKRAIGKLARIDEITRTLPGSDCGLCGAPTCAALAEDIALGRADADACVRLAEAKESSP